MQFDIAILISTCQKIFSLENEAEWMKKWKKTEIIHFIWKDFEPNRTGVSFEMKHRQRKLNSVLKRNFIWHLVPVILQRSEKQLLRVLSFRSDAFDHCKVLNKINLVNTYLDPGKSSTPKAHNSIDGSLPHGKKLYTWFLEKSIFSNLLKFIYQYSTT